LPFIRGVQVSQSKRTLCCPHSPPLMRSWPKVGPPFVDSWLGDCR